MEPEDVHFRSSEHLIDGEELHKAERPPMSRIPTFQSPLTRMRLTIPSAESPLKMDGSSQPGQTERAESTEAGREKTALPIPSDIPPHTFSSSPLNRDHYFDQSPAITVDSDQTKSSLKRPPLRNPHENLIASDLLTDAVSETASEETLSEDELMSAQDAAVEDLSSCSSVNHHETSDQPSEDTLEKDMDKESEEETVQQSEHAEEDCVTEEIVKRSSDPEKVDGGIFQHDSVTMQKPSDGKNTEMKKCLKEIRQATRADTTHAKHRKSRMSTPSKQTKGRSCAVCCFLPSVLLLLAGFGLHVWQYGIPMSVSQLMSQLELHWLDSFWMPQDTCTSDCRLALVESVPDGIYFPTGSQNLSSISDAWTNLLNRANSSTHIAAFYLTLRDSDLGLTEPSSVLGKKVFEQLKQLELRGVKLKIAVNAPQSYIADTDELEATGAEVRGIDLQSITGGILHTTLWVVDQKHMYVGSANMDWRSLTQVREVGVSVEDCSCLAQDASRIFNIYWNIGAKKNPSLPPFWPGQFSALSSSKYPLAVKFNDVPARVYLSSSPPALSSSGRSDDLSSILSVISDAQKFIYVSVMDYLPVSQFIEPVRFWPAIDSALREAACARGVEVKLLVSCWSHSPGSMFIFLQSLSVLSKPPLSCSVHTKVFEVPSTREQQRIPSARVNHAKYMVTDRVVYIGTSNWCENAFTQTAGVGLVVNQTGSAVRQGQQTVQSQLENIFQRDWHSQYAQPLSDVHAQHCSGIKLT